LYRAIQAKLFHKALGCFADSQKDVLLARRHALLFIDRGLFLPTVPLFSAFHSSIVKVLPEASFACFYVAVFEDR